MSRQKRTYRNEQVKTQVINKPINIEIKEETLQNTEKESFKNYTVKTNVKLLAIRKEPKITSDMIEVAVEGETLTISNEKDGWGYVEARGWVNLSFVSRI